MLELEIQSLLILHGSSNGAAQALYEKYKHSELSLQETRIISYFLLSCNNPILLINFCLEQLKSQNFNKIKNNPVRQSFAWGHFAEAIMLISPAASEDIWQSLYDGAEQLEQLGELSKSPAALSRLQKLSDVKDSFRREQLVILQRKKSEILLQIETLQSQGMDEAEGNLLERGLKMFPRDNDLQKQYQNYREKLAMRVLDRRSELNKKNDDADLDSHRHLEVDAPEVLEIKNLLHQQLVEILSEKKSDHLPLRLDFSVAEKMWDSPELALSTLQASNEKLSAAEKWLKLELLLQSKRYLDLLSELPIFEAEVANQPDATLTLNYYRALALWGLSERKQAYSLLEQITTLQPQFLSASAMLSRWKKVLK